MPPVAAATTELELGQIALDPHAAKVPPVSSIPAEAQAKLYRETDARFAAQTGITRKLDPHNPVDKPLTEAWFHVYQQVLAEYKSGQVHWSIDHLPVIKAVTDAHAFATAAADALAGPKPGASRDDLVKHGTAAQAHLDASAAASKKAGAVMPGQHPKLVGLLEEAKAMLPGVMEWISTSKQATPADAVTALEVQRAPDHAKAVAAVAPPAPTAPRGETRSMAEMAANAREYAAKVKESRYTGYDVRQPTAGVRGGGIARFDTIKQALAWFDAGRVPGTYYMAIFDREDSKWPGPIMEYPHDDAVETSDQRGGGRPMPWGAFLGVCGAFGAVLAISSAKK
jgi:hypothetical protein